VKPSDVVITPKLDRMFRSASDALGTLEEMKDQGIGLHMIDLGGDVWGNGISKLIFTILSAVAENERDRIRERIRDVKRHLAGQGVYGGGKRPFGFDVVGEGKAKRLVPNAEEQAVVARMRALRDKGESFHRIGAAVGKPAMTVKRILDRFAGIGNLASNAGPASSRTEKPRWHGRAPSCLGACPADAPRPLRGRRLRLVRGSE
jgi:putative DNA-invertase from lambdoid prophage Rac